MARPTVGYVKRALIRDEGYPVGQPAPIYIRCGCGEKVYVTLGVEAEYPCKCGIVYDESGWILDDPKVA